MCGLDKLPCGKNILPVECNQPSGLRCYSGGAFKRPRLGVVQRRVARPVIASLPKTSGSVLIVYESYPTLPLRVNRARIPRQTGTGTVVRIGGGCRAAIRNTVHSSPTKSIVREPYSESAPGSQISPRSQGIRPQSAQALVIMNEPIAASPPLTGAVMFVIASRPGIPGLLRGADRAIPANSLQGVYRSASPP